MALLLASSMTFAQGYELSWYTIDSGGGYSTGGGFELEGTVGQPDTGSQTAGGYELRGGFWNLPSAQCGLLGDVNLDAVVDLDDVANFAGLLLEPESGDAAEICAADLNGDGSVDGLDIQGFTDLLVTP